MNGMQPLAHLWEEREEGWWHLAPPPLCLPYPRGPSGHPLQLLEIVGTEAQQDFNIQPLGKQTPSQAGFRFLEVRWPGPVSGGTVQWIRDLLEQLQDGPRGEDSRLE